MKLILFLAMIFGAAYLFGNYYNFRPDIMRPMLVQINHARENNPQALCNMLSLDATVTINDNVPRNKVNLTNVDRIEGCKYLTQAAPLMLPNNPPRKNGFIRDILENVTVVHENIVHREGSATFSTTEQRREMREQRGGAGILLTGKATTKVNMQRRWMGSNWNCMFNSKDKPECPPEWDNGMEITHLELTRHYDIITE